MITDSDPGYFDLPIASNVNVVNLILRTDSYKVTHAPQYPPGTEQIYAYFESRQIKSDLVMFGMQYHIDQLFTIRVTLEDLRQARAFSVQHFGRDLVRKDDWLYIINKYDGYLPLDIYGVPEGTVVPGRNVMFVMFNRDKRLFWLTNYLETPLSWMWYPITIATNSYYCKQDIKRWLILTGCDQAGADFMLHDFGFRGVTCFEQAAIGGMAHLTSFKGTDTMGAILQGIQTYGSAMTGFSIPASEHSTITSWGLENEAQAYENMLEAYPTGLFACVSDSKDIFNAVENIWGGTLRAKVMQRDGKVVIRPDSGDPVEVNRRLLEIMWDKFGGTTNGAGYKVLDSHVGIIQGDGIDRQMINDILSMATYEGFAASNFAFGSGGGLLQKFNRDTFKFAIKCSAAVIDGEMRHVHKDPITDPGKKSKSGFVYLAGTRAGDYRSVSHFDPEMTITAKDTAFVPYVVNGKIVRRDSFDAIRERLIAHTPAL